MTLLFSSLLFYFPWCLSPTPKISSAFPQLLTFFHVQKTVPKMELKNIPPSQVNLYHGLPFLTTKVERKKQKTYTEIIKFWSQTFWEGKQSV